MFTGRLEAKGGMNTLKRGSFEARARVEMLLFGRKVRWRIGDGCETATEGFG